MKKNTSFNDKSSQLSEVLKDNLQKNNAKMNKARLSLISMVILALCKMKSSGFDIEKTHLQDLQRIEKLLCLVLQSG